MEISTLFTKLFRVQAPIVLAPMYGYTGGKLAAAVARGGGLGVIAGGPCRDIEALAKDVAEYQAHAPPRSPLAIGVVSWAAAQGAEAPLAKVLERFSPDVVWFFAPAVPSPEAYPMCRAKGAKIIAQVGTLADAQEAAAHGADCIVCQGTEAGGHGLSQGRGTLAFAAATVDALRDGFSKPILAAGGISGGSGVAAALALGCDGAVLGTRFWASREAMGSAAAKAALVPAQGDNTIRTRAYDAVSRVVRGVAWPVPYDSSRVVRNQFTADYDGKEHQLEGILKAEAAGAIKGGVTAKLADATSKSEFSGYAILYSGEGVDLVKGIDEGAEEMTRRIMRETNAALDRLENLRPSQQRDS